MSEKKAKRARDRRRSLSYAPSDRSEAPTFWQRFWRASGDLPVLFGGMALVSLWMMFPNSAGPTMLALAIGLSALELVLIVRFVRRPLDTDRSPPRYGQAGVLAIAYSILLLCYCRAFYNAGWTATRALFLLVLTVNFVFVFVLTCVRKRR